MRTGTLVLNYHHVHDADDGAFRITPAQLRAQLQWLRAQGYAILALDELLARPAAWLEPGKRVLITFDDAYEDFLHCACPVLEELGVPSTLFVITDFIGGWNSWDRLRRSPHRHLDLDQLCRLRDRGVTFGSHSRTHCVLPRLRGEALHSEVRDSRHALERALGVRVRAFAYPGGHVNARVSGVVDDYYDLAFSTHLDAGARAGQPHRIPRIEASQFPSLYQFENALSKHALACSTATSKRYWEVSMRLRIGNPFTTTRDTDTIRPNMLKEFVRYASTPIKARLVPRFPKVRADRILGIACTGHGASLAYMDSSGLLRSSQLERWTGVKHMMMFSADEDDAIRNPRSAVDRNINYVFKHGFGRLPHSVTFEERIIPWLRWLLRDQHIEPEDIDLVVTSNGHFATGWARLGPVLKQWFPAARVSRNIEHHEIHQRQAFWPSGFEEAAVLTLDTCGEPLPRLGGRRLSGTMAVMNRSGKCRILKEFCFPEMSSGTIYDAVTHHVGFRQGDEGKTMGLAPLGEPELYEELRPHLRLFADGGFAFLDNAALQARLDAYVPACLPGAEITPRHANVAYAGQAILEDIVTNAWQAILALTGQRSLVYAGGVALNSVANEKAYRRVQPERLYVPPCPGDPGQALGCVLFGAYEMAGWTPVESEVPEYLGPPYTAEEMAAAPAASGFPTERPPDLEAAVARCMANGHIVARFDGSSEFGPRALGNRSILCDPRRPGMKDYLNARVKHREAFRPFAPTVLEERAAEWFDLDRRSAYMLRVVAIRPDRLQQVPAIAHVDATARVQTLAQSENPGYWRLIKAFEALTGVPLVLNTSFNLAGKPIVESPRDAVDCFVETEIDVLVLGPQVISKQPLAHYLSTTSGA
jgi:carbamoyltransferase